MEYSCIGLNDLPDEILMIIFRKLNNLDIFYSLEGVNSRLNQIIQDSIFTNRLTFVKSFSHNIIDRFPCDTILSRFCSQILPKIQHQIQWLDLSSSSMKYILHAGHYPKLFGLGLYNINEELIQYLFTDEILSFGIFKNQITKLLITMDKNDDYDDMLLSVENICTYIFSVFSRLRTLTLYESSYENLIRLNFNDPLPSKIRSSTLLKLNIGVQSFDDCLYLLDGRFDQLHTLYVDLVNTHRPLKLKNQSNLPNLRCFSLCSNYETSDYNKTILPLLNRMSNLEELDLCFMVYGYGTFIDGNHLKRNVINRMLRLDRFRFYISSLVSIYDNVNLPSREDIQHTFIGFSNAEIIAYIDYFPEAKQARCHSYSHPAFMPYYSCITNNFPGGLFKYVRQVSLRDEYPFEHEFFFRINQSFPCMDRLFVTNHKPQKHKPSHKLKNDNQNLSVIKYRFTELRIINGHDDYIEEFLFDTKAYLNNSITLYIHYEPLRRVIENFTRDTTSINCAKIHKLYFFGNEKYPTSLQQYFPNAEIRIHGW